MDKSTATKQAIKLFQEKHKALGNDDVILMFAILNKYKINKLTELDKIYKDILWQKEILPKYKKSRDYLEEHKKISEL